MKTEVQEIRKAFARNGFPDVVVYPPRGLKSHCEDYLIKSIAAADRRFAEGKIRSPMVGCPSVADADHQAKVMRALLERYDETGGEGWSTTRPSND